MLEGVSWPCLFPQNLPSGVLPMDKGESSRQCRGGAGAAAQGRGALCQGGGRLRGCRAPRSAAGALPLHGWAPHKAEGAGAAALGAGGGWCMQSGPARDCGGGRRREGHCTVPREGLPQGMELRCRILHAVEMLGAAREQGRGSAGSEVPVLRGGEVLGAARRRGDGGG